MSFITDLFGGGDAPTVAPYQASPVSTTTGTVTPTGQGGVTTQLSPELQKFYDYFLQSAMKNMPTAQSQEFANAVSDYGQNLFRQSTNLDTGALTSDYYNKVMAGLDPQRQAENAQLANTLFKQGRTGLGSGVEGGYVNPEQFALLKAREQANAGIYLTAQDRARQIQQENLKNALGFVGAGGDLKTAGYALPTTLFGTGVQLGQINNPLIAPALQGGQNVTAVNQTNAQIQAQNQANNLGFWGGLIGAGFSALNPFGSLSSLLTPTASSGAGAYTHSIFN